MSEELQTCTVCTGLFNIETEGGAEGFIGMLPVAFCPTCRVGILDFADVVASEAFGRGYHDAVAMFAHPIPGEEHLNAEIDDAWEIYQEEQRL